ncbi:MAG: hypothetical protein COA43_04220 [Robiginitomaculum sp.]|nr:MAG: hypothetical protein COA43_04220 [Robiginitomaculum sp.]
MITLKTATHIALAMCFSACATQYQISPPDNYLATKARLDNLAAPILKEWQNKCGETIGELKPVSPKCDHEITLNDDNIINAYASGEEIIITKGMMLSVDDLTLSLIIAHELAHNVLEHINLDHTETRELDADRWAMYMLKFIGLDYETAGLQTASFRIPQNNEYPEESDVKTDVKKQVSKEELVLRETRRANHFIAVIKDIKAEK